MYSASHKNKLIQKHIIKACFENSEELFDALVQRYLTAIHQVNVKKMMSVGKVELESKQFKCDAFVCSTEALAGIDVELQFQKIKFRGVKAANRNMKIWMENLLYAFNLTCGIQFGTFTAEFKIIYKLTLFGNFPTKMLCLEFFVAYLRNTASVNDAQELPNQVVKNITRIYKALVSLWRYSTHKWITPDTVRVQYKDFHQFKSHTNQILTLIAEKFTFSCFYKIALQFHVHAGNFYAINKEDKIWPQCLRLNFKIMIAILRKHPTDGITDDFRDDIYDTSDHRIVMTRLLAVNSANQPKKDEDNFASLICFWHNRFLDDGFSETQLLEFLNNVTFAQHELLYAVTELYKMKQWRIMRDNDHSRTDQIIAELKAEKMRHLRMLPDVQETLFTQLCQTDDFFQVLLRHVDILKVQISSGNLHEFSDASLSYAAALLLQFAGDAANSNKLQLRFFMCYVLNHFAHAFHEANILVLGLDALTICFLPRALQPQVQIALFMMFEKLLRVDQLRLLLCQYMPQLWAVGAVNRQQICKLLFELLNMREVDCQSEIGFLLPLVVCTSDLSNCDILMSTEMNDNMELAKPRVRLHCCKCAGYGGNNAVQSYLLDYNSRECLLPHPPQPDSEITLKQIYERLAGLEWVHDRLKTDPNFTCILAHLNASNELSLMQLDRAIQMDGAREPNMQLMERILYSGYRQLGEGSVTYCMLKLMGQLRFSLEAHMESAENELTAKRRVMTMR